MACLPCVPNSISDIEIQYLKHCIESKTTKDSKIRPYPILTDDCWIWNGYTDGSGYAVFNSDLTKKLRIVRVNRLSMYLFKHIEWNHELHVLHSCDNRICINPNHLRMGTHSENVKDRVERGKLEKSGVKKNTIKFTENQINEIKDLRLSGKTYPEIAKLYNIHPKSIERICIGATKYTEPVEKPSRIELISGNVIEYTNAGMTTDEICSKLKTSSATVAAIRKDIAKPELKIESKELQERVIELYNKAKTIKEISEECSIGTTLVNKIISKSGIKRVSKSERARDEIMGLIAQGKTQAQICEQTGFCRSIVSRIINSNSK